MAFEKIFTCVVEGRERNLWYRAMPLGAEWEDPPLGGEPYALLFVIAADDITVEDMGAIGEKIIRSGCRYVITAGNQAEKLHDVIDEAVAYLSVLAKEANESEPADLMTTWANGELSNDALFDLIFTTDYDDLKFVHYAIVVYGGKDESKARIISMIKQVVSEYL
jgi:hypothetical protein